MNARATKRKPKHEMTEVIVSSLIFQGGCDGRVTVERKMLFALGVGHALQFIP